MKLQYVLVVCLLLLSAGCERHGTDESRPRSAQGCYRYLVILAPHSYFDRRTGLKIENLDVQPLPIGDPGQSPFSEGLCMVRQLSSGKVGFIDMMGNFVIEPQFDGGEPYAPDFGQRFSEGRATVVMDGKVGMIDTLGRWVVKPGGYKSVYNCSEGRCLFEDQNGKYGYLDSRGKVIIPPLYGDANSFAEGLACVEDFDGNTFYIDRNGEKRFSLPKDAYSRGFSEGMAAVWYPAIGPYSRRSSGRIAPVKPSLWGFVSTSGEQVIKPQFASVGDFHEGLVVIVL